MSFSFISPNRGDARRAERSAAPEELYALAYTTLREMGLEMFYDAISVKYVDTNILEVEFQDGVLSWPPGDIDIAPEEVYARATGIPLEKLVGKNC